MRGDGGVAAVRSVVVIIILYHHMVIKTKSITKIDNQVKQLCWLAQGAPVSKPEMSKDPAHLSTSMNACFHPICNSFLLA